MLQVATLAAQKAADVLISNLNISKRVQRKTGRDIVTNVDWLAQEVIVKTIREHFPGHDILAEESSDLNDSPYLWIVDPLDGTINHLNKLPFFCTSIALAHEGKIILGVVYDPLRDVLFDTNKNLCVSGTLRLIDATIAMDWPADDNRDDSLRLASAIIHHVRTLRSFGSAALSLCYVAAGWLDGFIHANIEPWDAAAGALIVQKAGGVVTDFAGQPWQLTSKQLVASNGVLHRELLDAITK